jgi:hypothetical protein
MNLPHTGDAGQPPRPGNTTGLTRKTGSAHTSLHRITMHANPYCAGKIDLWHYSDKPHLPNQAAMQMLSKVGIRVNLKEYRGNSQQMSL